MTPGGGADVGSERPTEPGRQSFRRSSRDTAPADTDSPYQAEHGVQADIPDIRLPSVAIAATTAFVLVLLAGALSLLTIAWVSGSVGHEIILPAALPGALAAALIAGWHTRGKREILQRAAQRLRQVLADPAVGPALDDAASGRPTRDGTDALLAGIDRVANTLARKNQQIQTQRLHDPLTGLPRRALLFDRLRHRLLSNQRRLEPFCLLMLDLDGFALINDTLGQATGDRVLKEVARRLTGTLRDGDTLARLGNDEFMLLLEGDLALSRGVAARVRQVLAEPLQHDGQMIDITASIGISAFPAHGEDEDSLARHADLALLKAKRNRSGIEVFDGQQHAAQPESAAISAPMSAPLRHALDSGQFQLLYQPKLDLQTGRICGIEALLRWQHPERGSLQPADFIDAAERGGLMREITRWTLREALAFAMRMSRAQLVMPVSLNISMRDIEASDFLSSLAETLLEHGLPGDRLCLEISATGGLAESEQARAALRAIADLGVSFAVDDFGAGYAAMQQLQQLPVHALKIHRAFVAGLLEHTGSEPIVRATIDLARQLGLRVVAEGVENLRQMRALAALGAHEVQGHHLARPMPGEELIRWVGQRESVHQGSGPG